MKSKLKSFPDWWYSDGEFPEPEVEPETLYKESLSHFPSSQNLYDIDFKPRKLKKSKPKASNTTNTAVRELSEILLEKNTQIEILEDKLSNVKSFYKNLQSEITFLKSQYNDLYSENSILKDIVSKLDVDKVKNNNSRKENLNSLFLTPEAPQEAVDAVWKALSKIYHPDCGGSEDKMKLINTDKDEFYKRNNWK